MDSMSPWMLNYLFNRYKQYLNPEQQDMNQTVVPHGNRTYHTQHYCAHRFLLETARKPINYSEIRSIKNVTNTYNGLYTLV